MHALHLPPRHLGRVTLLAALLTLCVMALMASAVRTGPDDVNAVSSRAPVSVPGAQPAPTLAKPHGAGKPVWVARPLAPPTLGLAR